MAKNTVPRGETSVIRHVFIMDSSSTAGAGLTALAYNTASLTGYYIYPGGTATALTLEDITTLGTYAAPTSAAHIRFKLIDNTNMPGWYELQFHNDWFSVANARRAACVQLKGATNMAPLNLEIDCIGFGIQAAEPDVNTKTIANDAITAAAIANGAIDAATFAADVDAEILSYIVDDATRIDASSLNTATVTSIPAILDDTGTAGVVVAAGSKTGYTLTATTGLGNQTANITGNLSGSVGSVTGAVGSVTGAVGSVTGNVGGNVTGSVGSVVGAVGSVTGNVGGDVAGSVGSVAGAVGSVTAGVTVTTNNDKSGYSLTATTGLGNQTANITGTVSGNSTHNAADVWSVSARTLTAIDEDSTTLDLDGTIRGALGMSTANLDTQISTLATAAALAAAKAILDKFNTMVVLDGAVYDFTSDALAAAPGGTGSDPLSSAVPGAYAAGTAGYVIGTYLDAAISGVGGAVGPGADSVTVTWTSEGNPVADGDVWVATDAAGTNVVAGTLQTDSNGQATFQLDAGSTYYFFGQKDGVNSIRGERFVATAD